MKTNVRRSPVVALRVLLGLVAIAAIGVSLALLWLRWDAGRPRDTWFDERQGTLVAAFARDRRWADGATAKTLELRSDSGLSATMRIVRPADPSSPVPVLVVLGGHRTGSDAVTLLDRSTARAIVALDYPYDGPQRTRGFFASLAVVPNVRQAFLDTPPAISLALDWLWEQPWVDRDRVVLAGASLGVPFAATAAARDRRLAGLTLVHGAADNRLWLETNIADRLRPAWLRPGVAAVSPRPVLIVGAREDERIPAGQTELLYESAGEPKKLRWTDGRHVQPGRTEVIEQLMRIVDEELTLLAS
jgi:dienelactone hydrolase